MRYTISNNKKKACFFLFISPDTCVGKMWENIHPSTLLVWKQTAQFHKMAIWQLLNYKCTFTLPWQLFFQNSSSHICTNRFAQKALFGGAIAWHNPSARGPRADWVNTLRERNTRWSYSEAVCSAQCWGHRGTGRGDSHALGAGPCKLLINRRVHTARLLTAVSSETWKETRAPGHEEQGLQWRSFPTITPFLPWTHIS